MCPYSTVPNVSAAPTFPSSHRGSSQSYPNRTPDRVLNHRYLRSLNFLPPDPNDAAPSADPRVQSTDAVTDPASEEQREQHQESVGAFISDAKVAKDSAVTCLQCNVVLLHSLNITVPDSVLSIIHNPCHPGDIQQSGASRSPVGDSVPLTDPQEAAGSSTYTVKLGVSSQHRVNEAHEPASGAGGPDCAPSFDAEEQLQFEDVEWDKADDDAEGVFEIVQADEGDRSQPSSHKRKVPERVRKAVFEALRFASCAGQEAALCL